MEKHLKTLQPKGQFWYWNQIISWDQDYDQQEF